MEALERIGSCSRAIDGGLSGEQLSKAHVHRGMGYGQIGQMDSAIADFTEALKTDKTNVPVWIARSRAYFHKQQQCSTWPKPSSRHLTTQWPRT